MNIYSILYHHSNSEYIWVDLQSFEFSFFPWFLLRGVGAPCHKNLYCSYSQFLLVFFLKCFQLQDILNSQSNDLLFHSWSDCSEGGEVHRIPKSWSVKSLCACIRVVVGAYAVIAFQWIFFKTSEKKKLRISGMYHISKSDLKHVWTS